MLRHKQKRTKKSLNATNWHGTMHLSITTLDINGLDCFVKIHRLADWIRKQNLEFCSL